MLVVLIKCQWVCGVQIVVRSWNRELHCTEPVLAFPLWVVVAALLFFGHFDSEFESSGCFSAGTHQASETPRLTVSPLQDKETSAPSHHSNLSTITSLDSQHVTNMCLL